MDINLDENDFLDIFRDLDTDLLEIFARSRREELQRWIRNNPHLARDITEAENRRQRDRNERVAHLVWLWVLPLPVVNYSLLWRRHRPANLTHWALRTGIALATILVRLLRFIAYLTFTGHWIRDMFRVMFIFCSLATYSENYFVDIITYVFRNLTDLVRRQMQQGNYPTFSIFEQAISNRLIYELVCNLIAAQLRVKCVGSASEPITCLVDQNALIFRFLDVLAKVFPLLLNVPQPILTALTVCLYLIYGIGCQFICTNVIFFLFMHTARRWTPAMDFLGRVSKMLLNSAPSMVF